MIRKLLLLGLWLCAAPAQAGWREASSKHFLVYSEGGEERLREAAVKLEKYDFLLRFITKAKPDDNPVKLKVYLLPPKDVADALPFGGGGVAGFYSTGVHGPFAVALRSDISGEDGLTAQEVLFHEYAHHFMFQNFPASYPTWYSEGFADYYGTTRILDHDVIEVGHSVRNRYLAFWGNGWLPLDRVLTAMNYGDVGGNLDLLYAEGWLLVHYLANTRERFGQLETYLDAINHGESYKAAMDKAFGKDAEELDSELHDYARKRRIMALRLPFKPIDVGEIAIRPLSPAEDALIDQEIALQAGIPARAAAKFASEVREKAERFPADPYAWSMIVEAERLAGNRAAAEAAVERWLALEPGSTDARMHKAELRFEALREGGVSDPAAWDKARSLLTTGKNRLPRNPRVLTAYYDSYVTQGLLPPPGAQNALVHAFELVPQDDALRYRVAADFEARDMLKEAIAIIRPAAFELHSSKEETPEEAKEREEDEAKHRLAGDTKRETAREMLERLERELAEGKTASANAAR